ncbi:hypothetical protein B0H21DRAFT_694198 [Amylocystis lapponica]|nr:hypothetical protein B0H21DRAFT_694198 [Amylocystis lapponica]
MHRCLQVAEILRNICKELYESGLDPDCRGDVGALNTTCTAFHLVAEEVLWSQLYGLHPLIKCMSDTILVETDVQEEDQSDSEEDFARVPGPDDWERFQAKAKYVKGLEWNFRFDSKKYQLSLNTLQMLALYRPPTSLLLPNLLELSWTEEREDATAYIHLFLGPRLTTLYIRQKPHHRVLGTLHSLGTQCSLLKTFIVKTTPLTTNSNAVCPVTSAAICALKHLETIRIPTMISTDTVIHLSMLPNLQFVDIVFNPDAELCSQLSTSNVSIFPAIDTFYLCVDRLTTSSAQLLSLIGSTDLNDVSLSSGEYPGPSAELLYDHLQRLLHLPCAPHITDMKLSFAHRVTARRLNQQALPLVANDPVRMLDLHVLSPLLQMRALQELDVEAFYLDLDNAGLSALCSALPELHTLRLAPTHPSGRILRITPIGLTAIFQHCRCLVNLTLSFDARDITGLNTALPSTFPFNSPLLVFDVMKSPIYDAGVLAVFLSIFFDRTGPVIIEDHDVDQDQGNMGLLRVVYRENWAKFRQVFPLCIEARRQERARQSDVGLKPAKYLDDYAAEL